MTSKTIDCSPAGPAAGVGGVLSSEAGVKVGEGVNVGEGVVVGAPEIVAPDTGVTGTVAVGVETGTVTAGVAVGTFTTGTTTGGGGGGE